MCLFISFGQKLLTIFLLCSILILFAGNAFAIEDNNYTVSQNIENCNSGFHVQDNFIDFNINLNDSSSADDRLGVSNEDLLADPVYPGGTNFSDIRQAIVSAHDGDTIFLKNLTYTGSGSEIVVDKQVTIVGGFSLDDGLMATLNARSLSQIFVISADNVILRNINFNYGKSSTDGGAIYWNGKNGNMSYCNFFNNTAMTYGGAVYWNSLNGNVANVIFTDNAAKDDTSYDYGGGAIYWKAANGKLSNAKFINNYARRGGAVYWAADNSNLSNIEFTNNTGWFGAALYWWGKYGKLSYSNFTNNSGDKGGTGGAFYIDQRGSYHDVSYCNFVNNSAVKVESGFGGGAIAWYATYGNLSFSNFTENHVNFAAGAVLWNGNYGNLWNCTFYKNYADGYAKSSYSGSLYKSGDAGAVRWVSRFGNLTNSTFIENYAWNSGGALWGDQIDATIDNCIFINNSAKDSNGGSIYWSTGGSTVEHAPKIINSVFINSTAKGFGGSINWDAPHANLINLTFINSSSEGYGAGAVAISGDYSLVYGCNFTNCTTKGNGGGLRSTMSFTNVTHCNFINTSAEGYKNYDGPGGGGAIYLYSQGSYISYSTFVNSSTAADGGALNLHATGIRVFNCSFENTSAKLDGGAISRKTHDVTVFDNLTFINSIAETGSGGAIYWKEPGVYTSTYMARCNFTNTSANQLGGAIYREQTNLIFDVNIVNTSAKRGGAIYFKYYGGSVSNVSVINTSATEKGGAIYSYSFFAPITNVSIINTTAGIDGGAIYLEYSESTLRNITCINASAKNFGGSIYSGYWGDWYDLKFINSSALDGGAIYKNYDTGNIVNATFINTTANRDGGAVYWTYYRDYNSKKSLINASFTNSHAKRDGGSIFWQAYKATFKNLTFNISSADRDGGAIFWNTTDANITELNFTNITAGRNGGAVYVNGANGNISNCNFTNNSAGNNGGALYWNGINGNLTSSNFDLNHASNNGGAIYWNGTAGNVEHSLLTNNTAIYGGGIYWRGNDGIINDLEFMGNNATNGSAIYKDRNSNSLTVTNVQFDKNRANAHHIEIEIEGNESYSLADVTVNIYLVANDNIANAIWNDGANNTILLANITCVYSENGIKRPEHTFNALTNPICPTYEIKDNSTLWQSPYEYAQLLDVVVTNPEGTVIYNLVDGKLQRTKSNTKNLLSAIKFDDEDINVTDKDGKIHIEFTNLEAGKYTIAAEHKWDKYYTNTVNRDNFIIYDLNVTKTTDDVLVTVGHNVTYNITIFNNGSQIAKDIKISDLIPSQLKLVDYNITWLNRSAPDWTLDYNENTNEFTIHNSNQFGDESFIPPFEKVLITLVFKSINLGTFNNTVSVLSNVTGDKPTNATSQNTTVVPVVLNVNKTVDVSPVVNNTVVNFTICVSNVGLGNATDLTVVDSLPAGLTVEDLGVISSPVGVDVTFVRFGNGGKWNISGLNSTDVVSLWITARTNVVDAMNLTNKVNVTCAENDTEVKNFTDVEVVPVVLNINKTANVTIVANNTLVKYVVVVKNNCNFNATDLVICDELPDGLIFENDATSGYYWDESTRVISWNLTKLDAGSIVEYYVVVRTNGTGFRTNKVNVTCVENDTEVKNSTTIEVVPVNLTIVKTATPGEVKVNENVTFTITVTNYGPANATGVNITDVLDDVFKFDGKSANGTFKVADKTIVWEIGNLTKGSSYSVCFNVTVLTNGTFLNVGTVSCTENSTEVSNKTDVTVLPIVDLKINKTVDKTNVTVGDEIIYTICVTNLGPSNATDVNVTDVMKGIVKITNVETHNIGKFDEKEGIWYIGNLNKDATVYLTLTVKTLSVGIVENVVSVNSTEEDKNTSNNEYLCENVTVNPAPSLVNGSDVNVTYGEPIVVDYDSVNATNVTYEIFDSGGNPILNGTVGPDGSIPVDQLPVGNYTVIWTTVVDANHTSATNTSKITVNPIPTHIVVGNVTARPGDNVTIPINVTADDGVLFNGNVTVILPDGTVRVVEIINGKGSVPWTVPDNYNGTYPVFVSFGGNAIYLASNGTGFVIVIPDNPEPVNPEPENHTVNEEPSIEVPMDNKATGNPILILFLLLLTLVFPQLRRFKK